MGKERDAETGLDYFGARYMSSAQGRFTSPDLPRVDQHLRDPQSWNLYSYARNSPLRNRDPNGRIFGIGNTCQSSPVGGGDSGGAGATSSWEVAQNSTAASQPAAQPKKRSTAGAGRTAAASGAATASVTVTASAAPIPVQPSPIAQVLPQSAVAASVETPYGLATQSAGAEAAEALSAAQNGAILYRAGMTGVQNTADAQFWFFTNPLTTANYANAMGMPSIAAESESVPFVIGGRLLPGAAAIARLAPAIGAAEGGAMELVTAANAVRLLWFVIP